MVATVTVAAATPVGAPAVSTRLKLGWAMGSVGTSTMLYLGLMVGVFALAEKGAYACGPLLTGLLLGAMGFVSSTTGELAQPLSAVLAARLAMSVIPAVIGGLAVVAILLYRLPAEADRR